MRTPVKIVRLTKICGNRPVITVELPRYRSSKIRTIADAARGVGDRHRAVPQSVRLDEDDRGERHDQLISNDAEELKRLPKENAELKCTNLTEAENVMRPGSRPAIALSGRRSYRNSASKS
jgi:hypothetical protein